MTCKIILNVSRKIYILKFFVFLIENNGDQSVSMLYLKLHYTWVALLTLDKGSE